MRYFWPMVALFLSSSLPSVAAFNDCADTGFECGFSLPCCWPSDICDGVCVSTTPNRKEPGSYRYVDGLCVDAHGAIGHNPLASVAFATPERKRIELKFGAAPGNFVYLETVDAECADLSGVEDFARDVLHVGSTGLWIQELDLRGAVGLKRFGRVDTPRARLEGAALPADFASGSHIAASADRLTLLGSVPALQACGDIKHRKGEWPDRIVEPNNVYCSTP